MHNIFPPNLYTQKHTTYTCTIVANTPHSLLESTVLPQEQYICGCPVLDIQSHQHMNLLSRDRSCHWPVHPSSHAQWFAARGQPVTITCFV